MGLFSRFTKKESERVLVIHIGSGSVAGAFVEVSDSRRTILSTVQADIAILSNISFERFEMEMEKSLATVLSALSASRIVPERVTVCLSSPWFASQVRVAKISRPTQFVITKSFLNDIVARELKAFAEELNAGKPEDPDMLRTIESKIVQVKENGYLVHSPVGVSAKELELSLFLSVAPEYVLEKVKDMIRHEFHRPISFSSLLSASFLVARDFFPHQDDYMLVHVGGEITDVSLVRESAPVQSASFPLGSNFILRQLARNLGRDIHESASLCTLYLEDKVENKVKEVCTRVLGEAKNEWLTSFQRALFTVTNEISIPDTVLLSVESSIAPWFVETIRREEFNQLPVTGKDFKVIVLNAEVFHEALSFAPDVPRNPFIMIEALAHEK